MAKSIAITEGVRGLFRGATTNAIAISVPFVLFSALTGHRNDVYPNSVLLSRRSDDPSSSSSPTSPFRGLLLPFSIGAASMLLVHPLDLLKKRRQIYADEAPLTSRALHHRLLSSSPLPPAAASRLALFFAAHPPPPPSLSASSLSPPSSSSSSSSRLAVSPLSSAVASVWRVAAALAHPTHRRELWRGGVATAAKAGVHVLASSLVFPAALYAACVAQQHRMVGGSDGGGVDWTVMAEFQRASVQHLA